MTDTTHSAMPETMAAAASPMDPADPPPPPASSPVNRISGTPSHWARSEVSKPML